jgi:hypothetical protein
MKPIRLNLLNLAPVLFSDNDFSAASTSTSLWWGQQSIDPLMNKIDRVAILLAYMVRPVSQTSPTGPLY